MYLCWVLLTSRPQRQGSFVRYTGLNPTLRSVDTHGPYTERLAEAGIEPSVGSKGDSYDNALAESVIGLFKTEVIRQEGPWRGLEEVEFATLDWVCWYNKQRLLGATIKRCVNSRGGEYPSGLT